MIQSHHLFLKPWFEHTFPTLFFILMVKCCKPLKFFKDQLAIEYIWVWNSYSCNSLPSTLYFWIDFQKDCLFWGINSSLLALLSFWLFSVTLLLYLTYLTFIEAAFSSFWSSPILKETCGFLSILSFWESKVDGLDDTFFLIDDIDFSRSYTVRNESISSFLFGLF